MTSLRVVVDGEALADPEARAFWKRFSDWMEGHQGDLAGFARTEGLASVHPEMAASGPVLVASRSEPQRPYATAVGSTSPPTRSPKVDHAPTHASRSPRSPRAPGGSGPSATARTSGAARASGPAGSSAASRRRGASKPKKAK